MKIHYLHIIIICVLCSCKKIIDKPVLYEQNDAPVIQALLTSDTNYQEIYISELLDQELDIITGKSNAEVYVYKPIINITNGDTTGYDTLYFEKDLHTKGLYTTDSFRFEYLNFYLEVILDQDTFHATDRAPKLIQTDTSINYLTQPTFVPLNENRDSFYLLNMYNYVGNPLVYTIRLDWSDVDAYTQLAYEENHAEISGFLFRTIDANQLFAPTAWVQAITFPKGTKFIIENYSTSEDHINYLRGIANETLWKGGIFDIQAGNPRTNINNGAFGFFAVSDRVIVKGIIE